MVKLMYGDFVPSITCCSTVTQHHALIAKSIARNSVSDLLQPDPSTISFIRGFRQGSKVLFSTCTLQSWNVECICGCTPRQIIAQKQYFRVFLKSSVRLEAVEITVYRYNASQVYLQTWVGSSISQPHSNRR
jgi:hypothetical protein